MQKLFDRERKKKRQREKKKNILEIFDEWKLSGKLKNDMINF